MNIPQISLAIVMSLWLSPVSHAGDWSGQADVSLLTGQYTGFSDKTSINSMGASLNMDYLELGGFKLAASNITIDTASGYPIYQTSWFASGRANQYCDTLGGVISLRMDVHQAKLNNDLSYADDVTAYAPQVAFLNYAKSFYADIGLALSTYKNGLEVQQLTPTVGFAFNDGADWLQTRAYLISTSDAALVQGVAQSQAVELKLTHWTAPDSMFDQYLFNILVGERVYAVDGDAAAIYSLADSQQGGGSAGLAWQNKSMSGLVMLGADAYRNQTTNLAYVSTFAYISVSKSW